MNENSDQWKPLPEVPFGIQIVAMFLVGALMGILLAGILLWVSADYLPGWIASSKPSWVFFVAIIGGTSAFLVLLYLNASSNGSGDFEPDDFGDVDR